LKLKETRLFISRHIISEAANSSKEGRHLDTATSLGQNYAS